MSEVDTNRVNTFTAVKNQAQRLTAIEKRMRLSFARGETKPWPIYGSGLLEYSKYFGEDLGARATEILQEKGQVNILELFGEGQVLRDLAQLPGMSRQPMVAVTLADIRTKPQETYDACRNIELITGSLFQGNTWAKIDKARLEMQQGQGYDLILCRPIGGWKIDNNYPAELVQFIIDKAFSRMEQQGKLYIAVYPDLQMEELLNLSSTQSLIDCHKTGMAANDCWVITKKTSSGRLNLITHNK